MSKKSALIAGLYAASAMTAYSEITNPYDGLPELQYNGSVIHRKSNLTKKQKKARAKAKRAKQARKKNRNK